MKFDETIKLYLEGYPRWLRILIAAVGIPLGGVCLFLFLPRPSCVVLSVLGAFLSFVSLFLLWHALVRFVSISIIFLIGMLSMIFVVVPVGRYIEDVYLENEFADYGVIAKGYVFKEKFGKHQTTKSGRYVYYFYMVGGSRFEDVVETDKYHAGDTLLVQYSNRDPEIHRLAMQ